MKTRAPQRFAIPLLLAAAVAVLAAVEFLPRETPHEDTTATVEAELPARSSPAETSATDALRLHRSANPPAFLDVREGWELARFGTVPGAAHIPRGELEDRIGELNPAEPLVIICRSGRRSRLAGQMLLREGFAEVHNMTGGMLTWEGPIQRDTPE